MVGWVWQPTYLALGHVVPAKGADDEAGVARVGLGAVAGVPRARHKLPLHEVLILRRRRRHLGRRPRWKKHEKRGRCKGPSISDVRTEGRGQVGPKAENSADRAIP